MHTARVYHNEAISGVGAVVNYYTHEFVARPRRAVKELRISAGYDNFNTGPQGRGCLYDSTHYIRRSRRAL
jgi:hypothetical protein